MIITNKQKSKFRTTRVIVWIRELCRRAPLNAGYFLLDLYKKVWEKNVNARTEEESLRETWNTVRTVRSSDRHFINGLKSPSFYMRVQFNKFGLKPVHTEHRTRERERKKSVGARQRIDTIRWFLFDSSFSYEVLADDTRGRRRNLRKYSIHREKIATLEERGFYTES